MVIKASILSLSLLVASEVQARTLDVLATAYCIGGLLKAGVSGEVIRQQGDNITIRLKYGNVYHGKIIDFVFDEDKKNDK